MFEATFKPPFAKFTKRQHRPLKTAIRDEVRAICTDPSIGEAKLGDLAGIRVHKFTYNKQVYLTAYAVPEPGAMDSINPQDTTPVLIEFYQIGSPENFYDDLKAYLRASG